MTIAIKVNGLKLSTFQSGSVIADIGAVAYGFSFTSTVDKQELFPVHVNDLVEILVDDTPILKGYIESLSGNYGVSGGKVRHQIKVSGRSLLCDLIDSTVPTQTEFESNNLVDICKEVMQGIGLEPKIINKAGTIEPFDDLISAEIGQKAYKFLESFSRKRQVLLTSDGFDSLVLTRASSERFPANLQHIKNSSQNNILNADFEINYRERYNKYSAVSELNPLAILLSKTTPVEIADQGDVVFDSKIRETRQLEFETEESLDDFTALDRAKWEANIRRAKSFTYGVTVQGHSAGGSLWLPNKIVNVVDRFADISADLLIKGVTFNYSLSSGSTTKLRLTYKDAYTLQVEQDAREANTESTGDGFF